MSTGNIKLRDELIREWVKSINRKDLINLLTKWDFRIKEEHFSKFELFKNAAKNSLTKEQFLEFWLLKEMGGLKNRNWVLYRYDSSILKKIEDLTLLKEKITQKLDNELKTNSDFNVLVHKFENKGIFIVLDFKGSPQIIEEFGFKFNVHHTIQRIRCLLGYNNYIQISSFSKNQINLSIKILKDILETKIEHVPIYSYAIRDFIQQMKPIEKLVIVCPREMGGFSGVERITIEGPDVVTGMEDLRSRQEILFNFEGLSKLGAWSIVKSRKAKMDVQGKIKLDEDVRDKVLYFLRS